ncbi:MAG: HAMP domain-containing histidine kinase [Deltaproteobacteria bacterium]|nr:HAMP domain-containing histidine kinase [Deltaproteobacteria bacterium]
MKFPRFSISDRGLQFKLTMVMMILLACSMGSVFIPYYFGKESLKHDLEESFLELSNAIRVSIDQLTAPAASEEDRLRGYVESLKRTGIREVSIVGEDMGIIDSTDPKAIGKVSRIKLPPEKLIINATFGEEVPGGRSKDLVIPVTVGGDTMGYIHVRLRIDDFTDTIRKNLYLRFFSTLLIFSLGLVLAVSISSHYVRPVEELAHAAEKVAAGDLSQELPVTGKDEVGRLTRSFNEMIVKLRQNRELEEKVRESQYLTQLGRLSSGVAHEIRNPLNFIALAVDHLDALSAGKTPEAEREKAQVVVRVKEEIQRLNELVTNFITYGRPPAPERAAVQLPEIVDSVLRMAENRMRTQGIRCRREYREGPPAPVDPDMIRRAVVNLVGNAIDAMPKGGDLCVSAGPREEGGYLLTVEDTGSGIAEENLDKIFEPYFTTKPSGLGLGLILTRKIVEAHGGEIVVDSQPGKGTRIHVLLPGGTAE